MTAGQEHVVLLVHGIRTNARWVGMVKDTIQRTSSTPLTVEPVSYGNFSLWRFLLPGPTRWSPISVVGKYLRAVRARQNDLQHSKFERRLISVIAHSFGTYCLFRVLDQNPNIALNRVILCGAVLPQNFDIGRYRAQLGSSKVLNECGDRDPWPVIAKKVAWGCGAAGTFGLFSERAINRFHRNGHSDYFDAGFVRDMWVPFLETGEVKASEWDKARSEHPGPRWIRTIAKIPSAPIALAIVVGIVFVVARSELNCLLFGQCIVQIVKEQWSQDVGGPGGNAFDPVTCARDEVLVGLHGKQGVNTDYRIFSIGPICATARFIHSTQIQAILTGSARRVPSVGSDQGQPFEVLCPPPAFVIGSDLQSSGFSDRGAYLVRPLTLKCAGRDTTPSNAVSVPDIQLSIASRHPFLCPANSLAAAIRGRAGEWIDALGIGCRAFAPSKW
jgi:hypothetical protein